MESGIASDCRCREEAFHYCKLALISLGLFLGEFAGGWLTGSLALISDSFHVLVDGTENVVSVTIARWARKSTDEQKLRRRGGYISAAMLSFVSLGIIYEAYARFFYRPHEIKGASMIAIALAGLAVNVFQYRLHRNVPGEHKNETHFWQNFHLISDAVMSVAVIFTGIIVLTTGRNYIDPFISFVIGMAILFIALRRLFLKPKHGHGHHHSH